MAISALAGSLLITNTPDAPYFQLLLPFLEGFTVFYWATGAWRIPMFLALGLWRYILKRFPLQYVPLYLGAVFPLGTYTVAPWQMARAMDLGFLEFVPRFFIYIALLAWVITFAGLIRIIDGAMARLLSR